jgi:hypothetical protein
MNNMRLPMIYPFERKEQDMELRHQKSTHLKRNRIYFCRIICFKALIIKTIAILTDNIMIASNIPEKGQKQA